MSDKLTTPLENAKAFMNSLEQIKNPEQTTDKTPATDEKSAKRYTINDVFYSLQGEGIRAGTSNVFIRFAGCNMRCDVAPGEKSPGGFACDTEFESGRAVTLKELESWIVTAVANRLGVTPDLVPMLLGSNKWLVLTGGEPALQVDGEFCDYFHKLGFKLAIETNGSIELPLCDVISASNGLGQYALDWITVSPKVAEHAIRQTFAHEVKYVRAYGQGVPRTKVIALHYLISPAYDGDRLDPKTLNWCIQLCLGNPKWRLSVQQHKGWRVR